MKIGFKTAQLFFNCSRYSTKMSAVKIQDAITRDHDIVKNLHSLYKSQTNPREKQKLANELIRQLAVHSHAEEIVVYPVFEARLSNGKEKANHSRQEHTQLKWELYRLDRMNQNTADFIQQADRVFDVFLKHSKEEEEKLLPELADKMSQDELAQLARDFDSIKSSVPTHPHPWAPDRPPLETLIAKMQAPIDKSYDYLAREYPDPRNFLNIKQ